MEKTAKNNMRLGLFVTVSTLLFITGVYYIGSRQNIFGSTYKISALFHNVGGLRAGNNVRYAGIKAGSVADIVFINDSTLRVDMQLDETIKDVIKKDAVASIGSDGLVGNVIVNINPGQGNMPPVENGDIILSYSGQGTDDMLKKLGNTNDNIALLSLNLLEITKKINEGQGTIPRLIQDSIMAEAISGTLQNILLVTKNLQNISGELQRTINHINKGEGTIGQMIYDTTLSSQLENFVPHLDTYLVNQTKPIFSELQNTSEQLSDASSELNEILENINKGDGMANTILKDTAAANDLKIILANLNEGTIRFSEDMEALKHNFLFRRYFKKLEKDKKKRSN